MLARIETKLAGQILVWLGVESLEDSTAELIVRNGWKLDMAPVSLD